MPIPLFVLASFNECVTVKMVLDAGTDKTWEPYAEHLRGRAMLESSGITQSFPRPADLCLFEGPSRSGLELTYQVRDERTHQSFAMASQSRGNNEEFRACRVDDDVE